VSYASGRSGVARRRSYLHVVRREKMSVARQESGVLNRRSNAGKSAGIWKEANLLIFYGVLNEIKLTLLRISDDTFWHLSRQRWQTARRLVKISQSYLSFDETINSEFLCNNEWIHLWHCAGLTSTVESLWRNATSPYCIHAQNLCEKHQTMEWNQATLCREMK